jgi:hypothetical protein
VSLWVCPHLTCEDSWYSCPLSEEGCADERQAGCNCIAVEANAALNALRAVLAEYLSRYPPSDSNARLRERARALLGEK